LDGMPYVADLKRKWSPTFGTGTLKRKLQLSAAARASKRNTHRIHGQFQSAFTGLASGLDETGSGHPEGGCGGQWTKSNPAICKS